MVTGCTVFDFANRGGGVVAAAAARAVELLSPCVVVAGEVLIGSREMRTMGIEAAYAVRESSLDAPPGISAGRTGSDRPSRGPDLELVVHTPPAWVVWPGLKPPLDWQRRE